MLDGQGRVIGAQKSAEALHRAIRRLRDTTRRVPGFSVTVADDPLVWASYIYVPTDPTLTILRTLAK